MRRKRERECMSRGTAADSAHQSQWPVALNLTQQKEPHKIEARLHNCISRAMVNSSSTQMVPELEKVQQEKK